MATDPETVPAIHDLAAEIQRAWDKEFSRPVGDGIDYRQARTAAETVMAAVEPFLAKPAPELPPVTATELLAWFHEQASEYGEMAKLEPEPGRHPDARANQKATADALTAVIAHVAVYRPEIPHALGQRGGQAVQR